MCSRLSRAPAKAITKRNGNVRIWIDTEFDGSGGRLISMALVAEDGKEWYEILDGPRATDSWVADNVMPVLGSKWPLSRAEMAQSLKLWLAQFTSVHIIADYPDDIAYFCRLLITAPGEMISTPPLSFEIDRSLPSTRDWSAVPHNALEDALVLAYFGKKQTVI